MGKGDISLMRLEFPIKNFLLVQEITEIQKHTIKDKDPTNKRQGMYDRENVGRSPESNVQWKFFGNW